jgi:cation:H+ antiporter
MQIVDFAALPLWVNVVIFAGTASLVWLAGVKLTAYAKIIADRTGAQQAFIGILLLGAVVSLPEMATTIAAATLGHARLAVNILLGGIAATMVILAVTDALTGDEPLSTDISHPVVLLQGVLVVLFLAIAASGIVVGDAPVGGVGMWTSALLAFYVLFIMLAKRYGTSERWIATDDTSPGKGKREPAPAHAHSRERSFVQICFLTAVAAIAILGSGFLLAATGEALAQQTGLGASFVGMLLGGVATSLPEVSTTVSAVRLAQYEMAFADAFGTNLFSVMLLFVADLAYAGGPILNEVDRFSLFATLLGILLTSVYLAGIVERRHRSIFGMGIDSVVVLLAYAEGLVVLFFLR